MSLIEIPVQLKVPEVFWCVKYDGENGYDLSKWVAEKTYGRQKLVIAQGRFPRLDYTSDEMSGTIVNDKLTPGDWLVVSTSQSWCQIMPEEQVTKSFTPTTGSHTIWKDGVTNG